MEKQKLLRNIDTVLKGDENVLEYFTGEIESIYRKIFRPSVSVIIPSYNEEKTISHVVSQAIDSRIVDEVLVIDDGSTDRTAVRAQKNGAFVISHQANYGKGSAMRTGLGNSKGNILLFVDGDMRSISTKKINSMILPIVEDKADFVKSYFTVEKTTKINRTKNLYRPLLRHLFEVDFRSPLSGQFAARREFLEKIEFETGYGIDISILIDAVRARLRIAEVSLGRLMHRRRKPADIERISDAVIKTIMHKSGVSVSAK